MSKLTNFLKMEIDYFDAQKQICEKSLRGLDPGHLNISTVKGTDYYFDPENGRKSIGTALNATVRQRISHHFFASYAAVMQNNIKACNDCIRKVKEYDPYSLIASFSKAYVNVPDEALKALGFIPDSYISSQKESSRYHNDSLRHKTASGILVRSKSEVLIANTYNSFNVLFEYEKPLILNDGTELLPDFTLLSKDHSRVIYHEHIGMLSDTSYRQNFHQKLDSYIDGGLIPFHDVFFTFEDQNGNIDFEAIYKIIKLILSY